MGSKTAERICLELKTKLAEWHIASGVVPLTDGPPLEILEDVQLVLESLGYSPSEITEALQAVSQQAGLAKNANAEDWIRQALTWLSSK